MMYLLPWLHNGVMYVLQFDGIARRQTPHLKDKETQDKNIAHMFAYVRIAFVYE